MLGRPSSMYPVSAWPVPPIITRVPTTYHFCTHLFLSDPVRPNLGYFAANTLKGYSCSPLKHYQSLIMVITECKECQGPLAGRLNWLPHPLPASEWVPPRIQVGGTLTLVEGGGSQFRRRNRHYGTLYTNSFSLMDIQFYTKPLSIYCIFDPLVLFLQEWRKKISQVNFSFN